MKIISWNVNGLRSVVKNGFLDWVKQEDPDILALQEIKIQENDLHFDLIHINDYHPFFNCADKKGYASVAVYSKFKPLAINKVLGVERFDHEGRFLELKFKDFNLINLYMPHGGRDKHNLEYKLHVYHALIEKLKNPSTALRTSLRTERLILCGDFNIAHKEIDLARPKENANNIMFTPIERFQIDRILNLGYLDSFRNFHPEGGKYTWLSYNKNSIEKNIGWRIDYMFIGKSMETKIKYAFILDDISLGSDHRPIGIVLWTS